MPEDDAVRRTAAVGRNGSAGSAASSRYRADFGQKKRAGGPPRADVCRGDPSSGRNEYEVEGEKRSYEGIGNSRDLSRRRILRFLRASLICA